MIQLQCVLKIFKLKTTDPITLAEFIICCRQCSFVVDNVHLLNSNATRNHYNKTTSIVVARVNIYVHVWYNGK